MILLTDYTFHLALVLLNERLEGYFDVNAVLDWICESRRHELEIQSSYRGSFDAPNRFAFRRTSALVSCPTRSS
jgi:hypothetical protein